MKKNIVLIALPIFIVLVLSACRLKIDDITIKCNELTGECTIKENTGNTGNDDQQDNSDEQDDENGGSTSLDSDQARLLVYTALKYAGYTREQFKPIAKRQGYTITDQTSWCAMFVSTIIKEAKIDDLKKYTSASVSTFMSAMVKDSRFYHSKYWYNQSGNFKDPTGPQTGDIVFFTKESCAKSKYKGNGVLPSKTSDCYRHIGIVVSATSSTITYVHGNTSGCKSFKGNGVCGNSTVSANSAYIIGYGR